MKKMKKIVSLLLALIMVFAMGTTVFAEGETGTETGTITVDNPVSGATYTAYKIFDVTYDKDLSGNAGSHYSYTIDSNNEWFSTVQSYATEANGLTLTQANGSTTYIVTTTDSFSAPSFANDLKNDVNGKTGTTLTIADGKATATGLNLGYYLVVGTKGAETEALANLTTTNPTVTIHDKNDVPFEKTDDKVSADVGEKVNYTITGKVPDYTGFTTYTYLVTDTMSEGLTFKKDVKVTVGEKEVTEACTIVYDVKENDTDENGNANKFTVSIPVKSYTIGAAIKVTYSAVVNENAVAKIENNQATLTYSNDPTNSESETTTPPDKETVYSAKIVIDKYAQNAENAEDMSTKLAGATFVLYKRGEASTTEPESGDYDTVKTNDETTVYYIREYYKYTDATETAGAKVEWVESKAQATPKVTGSNGAAFFDGLADGTYYLEETAAPAGYNLLDEPVPVTVNGTNATVDNLSSLTVTEKVANSTGSLLPSTGGMGTTIFYVLGAILVLGAGVILITRRRMSR